MAKYTQLCVINLKQDQLVPLSVRKNRDAYHWKQRHKLNSTPLDAKGVDKLMLRCCECGAINVVNCNSGGLVTCDDCSETLFEVLQCVGIKEFECSEEPRFVCMMKTKLQYRVLLQTTHTEGVWRFEREGADPTATSEQMNAENGYFSCLVAPGDTLRVRLFRQDGAISRVYSYNVPQRALPNPTCTICGTKFEASSPHFATCPTCNSRYEAKDYDWSPCGRKIDCHCGNTLVFRNKNSLLCGRCGRRVYFDTKDKAWYYSENEKKEASPPPPTKHHSPIPPSHKQAAGFNCVNCGTYVSAEKALCPNCHAEYRKENGRWTLTHYRRQCPACSKHLYRPTPDNYTCPHCSSYIAYNPKLKIWHVGNKKTSSEVKGWIAAFIAGVLAYDYTDLYLATFIFAAIAGVFVDQITTQPKTQNTRNNIRHCIFCAIAMFIGLSNGAEWLLPLYALAALVISCMFDD